MIIIDESRGSHDYKKWRKRTLHPTYITKKMTTEELLVFIKKPLVADSFNIFLYTLKRISLRKFAISDSPDNFCLSEIVDTSRGAERVLDPLELPYSLHQSYHGPLKLYIRKKVYTSDSQFDMPEDCSH